MASTENEILQRMIGQARLLNPNLSFEPLTPERIILEVVAQEIASGEIDQIGLENALNIESKFGENLENFTQLFGFGRKEATYATGYVIFSRPESASTLINIPAGTLIQGRQSYTTTSNVITALVTFQTVNAVTLPPEGKETGPVPIRCLTTGSSGNLPANTITEFVAETNIPGVTKVFNPSPTSGGQDSENDNALKARFKNTIFRNMAGTEAQYYATAAQTQGTSRVNVLGPISNYTEYSQIPSVADNLTDDTLNNDLEAYDYWGFRPRFLITKAKIISSSGTRDVIQFPTNNSESKALYKEIITVGERVVPYTEKEPREKCLVEPANAATVSEYPLSGTEYNKVKLSSTFGSEYENKEVLVLIGENGSSDNLYTTALTTIPYAKNIWATRPVFLTNGETGAGRYFYRENVDYIFNLIPRMGGDTLRYFLAGIAENPLTSRVAKKHPNLTLLNVGNTKVGQSMIPGQMLLLEFSYTSNASRNDLERNITNAVDIYIDGETTEQTTLAINIDTNLKKTIFNINPESPYYFGNYRRAGTPNSRPTVGNILVPLLQQPVTELPNEFILGVNRYYLGVHYWLVEDVSESGHSIRGRSGIEWNTRLQGDSEGIGSIASSENYPPLPSEEKTELYPIPTYEGETPSSLTSGTIEIKEEPYGFNKNVVELQAALENVRQTNVDALAHGPTVRYLKPDVTVVYEQGNPVSRVNEGIRKAVEAYFSSVNFGQPIILSDILNVIHNVQGVSNVRWTADITNSLNTTRVYETDINGRPLVFPGIRRILPGSSSHEIYEKQQIALPIGLTSGTIVFEYPEKPEFAGQEKTSRRSFYFNSKASTEAEKEFSKYFVKLLEKYLSTEASTEKIYKEGGLYPPVIESSETTGQPINIFNITYKNFKAFLPIIYLEGFGSTEFVHSSDFYLKDNEIAALPIHKQRALGTLPEDVVNGITIRTRSQSAFQRGN